MTGEIGGAEMADPSYWVKHVGAPVQFSAGLSVLQEQGIDTFVEIGPHPVLVGMGQACIADESTRWVPSLRRQRDDQAQLLSGLASLYVAGADIDWTASMRGAEDAGSPSRPIRSSVSGYWLAPVERRVRDRTETYEQWLYEITWPVMDPPAPRAGAAPGRWLVVEAGHGLGRTISEELAKRGQVSVLVSVDDLEDVTPPDLGWWGVVLVTGTAQVEMGTGEERDVESLADLLATTHAVLGGNRLASGGRLWVVTRNAQSGGRRDAPVRPGQASLWGFANAVSVERPSLRIACIDVELDAANPSAIVDELVADGEEDRIVLRGGDASLCPLGAPAAPVTSGSTRLSPDGTYLVTGGLGGLGLEAAKTLTRLGARHLALIGRRQASTVAQSVIEELRRAGVEVCVISADVAERDQLRAGTPWDPGDHACAPGRYTRRRHHQRGPHWGPGLAQLPRRPATEGGWGVVPARAHRR